MGIRARDRSHAIISLILKCGNADAPVAVMCACGWSWELPEPWEWRSEAGRADKLLDAYLVHRSVGPVPDRDVSIKFQNDTRDDDDNPYGWAE